MAASLEALLREQQDLLERAMACQRTLRQRLAEQSPPESTSKTGFEASFTSVRVTEAKLGGVVAWSDLKSPLLGPDGSKSSSAAFKDGSPHSILRSMRATEKLGENSRKHMISLKVREKLINPDEEHMFYSEEGVWQQFVRSQCFSVSTVLAIITNLIWIGVITDGGLPDALSTCIDNVFCTFFTVEIIARFLAHKRAVNALTRAFCFDLLLAMMMIGECWAIPLLGIDVGDARSTSILRILRLLRLAKLLRSARVLAYCPELLYLVNGLVVAGRSVAAVFGLLLVIIYFFAVLFTQLLRGTKQGSGSFDNVPLAMYTLLLQIFCGFDAEFFGKMLEVGSVYFLTYLSFVVLGSWTLMNMLIGVLCDIVSSVANEQKEIASARETEASIHTMARMLDSDSSGDVDLKEFNSIVESEPMLQVLSTVGVNIPELVDYMHFMYEQTESLTYEELLNVVLQFRESKDAKLIDLLCLQKHISRETMYLEQVLGESRRPRELEKAKQQELRNDSARTQQRLESSNEDSPRARLRHGLRQVRGGDVSL